MTMALVASEGWSSVSGVQLTPPSVVFQTPPEAAPIYITLLSRGSMAIALQRPAVEEAVLPLVGFGPINVHVAESSARPVSEAPVCARVRWRCRAAASTWRNCRMAFTRAPAGIEALGKARC